MKTKTVNLSKWKSEGQGVSLQGAWRGVHDYKPNVQETGKRDLSKESLQK